MSISVRAKGLMYKTGGLTAAGALIAVEILTMLTIDTVVVDGLS